HPSDCHYISGNEWAKKRIDSLKALLPRKGINPDRLWFVYVSAAEGNVYQSTMIKMNDLLQKMKSGGVSWGDQVAEAPQAK
ncbi:MAG TPA: hydrogenase iron-sulfur subunit, partial [Thermoproteota archaeon]|nr:hydrogenase iron-sulfur subunit [Thermoproteota archaeon]